MKKPVSLVLVFLFILVVGGICFAAPTVPDEAVPGSPVTVDSATYGETPVDIMDEGVAGDGSDTSMEIIEDEEVAKDLPKTGGVPSEAFYGVGGLFVVAALVLSRKKAKA